MAARDRRYRLSVFLNCPFDEAYGPLFRGLVFAVHACGFVARSALERADAGEVRISKIIELIRSCKYGIHDLSRVEPDPTSGLPRFNMPLELGISLGAKYFLGHAGSARQLLILDRERYRFQKFCSDIAGQDIRAHGNDARRLVSLARDWLAATPEGSKMLLPTPRLLDRWFGEFDGAVPQIAHSMGRALGEIAFVDLSKLVTVWLKARTGQA